MKKVLVIDDHGPSRRQLTQSLQQCGYEIAGEDGCGKNLPQLARSLMPDVALVAVGLADMDGISAAGAVMQTCPLPIVIITSHDDSATVQRATHAGVMGFLVKPLRASEVAPAIELAVKNYQEFLALRKENHDLKRTLEARKIIERAKGILMRQQNLSEAEAFVLIKRQSMNMRKPMQEIAQAILLAAEITETKR